MMKVCPHITILPGSSKLIRKREASGSSLGSRLGTCGINAALVDKVAEQAVHGRIVRTANERGALPLLPNEFCHDQSMQVMGESRSRDPKLLLQPSDRQSGLARSHERSIDPQAGGVAECLELPCCLFDFHGNNVIPTSTRVKSYF
jgi:hypothetical protein